MSQRRMPERVCPRAAWRHCPSRCPGPGRAVPRGRAPRGSTHPKLPWSPSTPLVPSVHALAARPRSHLLPATIAHAGKVRVPPRRAPDSRIEVCAAYERSRQASSRACALRHRPRALHRAAFEPPPPSSTVRLRPWPPNHPRLFPGLHRSSSYRTLPGIAAASPGL
jgi:hypothetical protein